MFSPLLAAGLMADKYTMKSDGTGGSNIGLFVRRTVRELFEGYTDVNPEGFKP